MKRFWLLSLTTLFATCSWAGYAFADGGKVASSSGWAAALGAGIAIALAAFGGALGQGRATAAALEGIARNPGARDQIFTPMILGLVLIESLVIYALVVALILTGKV